MQVPGGGIDTGETPETAAMREAFEETGLRFSQAVYLGCKEYFDGINVQMGHGVWLLRVHPMRGSILLKKNIS
ncbi:MAG: NUDIX domain-containing protein, partial [Trueperaceae bacterium]